MYKCKYCDKEFFFEGKLKRHLLFNHPNEPEDSDLYLRIRDEVLATTREQAVTSLAEIEDDDYLRIFGMPTQQRRGRFNIYMSGYPSVQWISNPITAEDLSAEWRDHFVNWSEGITLGQSI